MSFRNVNRQEAHPIAILFVKLVQGGNLPPEGRSSVAAEDEHNRLSLVQVSEPNVSAFIDFHQREIWSRIAQVQISGAGMDPHGLKRKEQKDERPGHFGHHAPELLRRLMHRPPEEGSEREINRDEGDNKRQQQFSEKWAYSKTKACHKLPQVYHCFRLITSSIRAARRQDKTEWSGMVDFWAS